MADRRSLIAVRAQALVDARKRVDRAERRAFPNGQCSYDAEWIAACEALHAEYRRSAVMVARAFLAMDAA